MQTALLTILVFGGAMLAMAVGVIFSRRPLKGSCGGTGEACSCSRAQRMRCPTLAHDTED
jgi:hypothetical protein